MNWMESIKRKISILLIMVMACACLGGCGDEIPDLTEEQQQLITDYSVLLLMRYDKRSPNKLLPENAVTRVEFVDPGTGAGSEIIPEEAPLDINVDSNPQYSDEGTTYTDAVTGESSGQSYGEGFESFLEGESITIDYSGNIEIVDTYPNGEDANPFLSVEASTGNKLLVAHFNISNPGSDTAAVNMGQLGLRYRMSINGGSNKYVMTTLLPNDLMSYVGEIGPGANVDAVAVCEISEEESSSVSSVDFTIKGKDHSSVIKLM